MTKYRTLHQKRISEAMKKLWRSKRWKHRRAAKKK